MEYKCGIPYNCLTKTTADTVKGIKSGVILNEENSARNGEK